MLRPRRRTYDGFVSVDAIWFTAEQRGLNRRGPVAQAVLIAVAGALFAGVCGLAASDRPPQPNALMAP